VEGTLMWSKGPWLSHLLPYYWELQAAAFISLAAYWAGRREASKLLQQSNGCSSSSCTSTRQAA